MTNTQNVKCSDCGEIYDYANSKCTKCGSANMTIIMIVNEKVDISENNISSLVMIFDLYDNVQIGGKITNSSNLEFIEDLEHPGTIKRFQIKINDPTLQDEKKAIEKASEITNYLSVKANRIVKHKLPLIHRIRENGITTTSIHYTVDAFLHKNFDLNANLLDSKLLGNNPDLNKRLQLYNDGLKELENNDFAGAIQSFHQCIEKTDLPEEKQYRPLRHAASHIVIDPWVVKKLKLMGIKIGLFGSLNENNPDNQNILKFKSQILKDTAFHYLDSKLSNL
ncbi:MAG: hypothetical protein ACRDFB_08170 [Rhabdochlamydiaceae bacterium]